MSLDAAVEEVLVRLWEQAGLAGTSGRTAAELGLAPDDPRLAELVASGLAGRDGERFALSRAGWTAAARAARCLPLTELRPGQAGRVACLDTAQPGILRKLMAMGVLPGSSIRVLRRSPAFVFRMGYSEFAVDASVANAIYIRVDGEHAPASLKMAAPRAPSRRMVLGGAPALLHGALEELLSAAFAVVPRSS